MFTARYGLGLYIERSELSVLIVSRTMTSGI